jgi:hypothetical protein
VNEKGGDELKVKGEVGNVAGRDVDDQLEKGEERTAERDGENRASVCEAMLAVHPPETLFMNVVCS